MASNSPGPFLGSIVFKENQEFPVVSGIQAEVGGTSGQLHLQLAGGLQRDASQQVRDSGYMSTSDGASTCSSSTAEICELEGGALLLMESKSLRSFTTNDEYLFAMKEDLADWFSSLYQNNEITADGFFSALETGVLLCKHANKVQEVAKQQREIGETLEMRSYFTRSVAEGNILYRERVKPATFQARDNISNFISWTRLLGIPEVLSFETDDLVLRKNEKSVILCLLEVARVGAKLGMQAPTLVQMEEEIDAELAGEERQPWVQIKTCDLRSLDERVRDLISRCTCPVQFPMVKVSDGKYKIGDTKSLIFVRILRNHVMVRVGGGWDTLENYLNKHDPCQCNYRGHKGSAAVVTHKVSQQRRSSHPGNNLFQTPNTQVSQIIVSSAANTSRNRSASPQNSSRSNSPNLVISRNIPPSKGHATSNRTSRGVYLIPSENQSELIAESWPCQPSKSGELIRSISPSPSHLRTSSSLTILQQTTPSGSVSHKTSSLSLLSRMNTNENTVKTLKPRKNTVSLAKRSASLAGHCQMMTQTSHLQVAFELTSDKANFVEFGSAAELSNEQQHDMPVKNNDMLAEHLKTYSQNQAEASIWNSVTEKSFTGQEMMPSKITMKVNDFKNVSGSEAGAERTMRRKSLPKVSSVTLGLSSVAFTNKQKENIFKNIDDETSCLIASHSEMQQQKVLHMPHKATDTLYKVKCAKLLKDANKYTEFQDATANFEWSESTIEAHLTKIPSTAPIILSQSKTVADSMNCAPQSSADNATAEDSMLVSPQKDTLCSTARERPASNSRIPKPCYTSRPSMARIPITSGSKCDFKDKAGLPKVSSQKNLHQGSTNTVSGKKPLTSSKSNSCLSGIKSSYEIPLSPNSPICNKRLKPVKSAVHSSYISDMFYSMDSGSADQRLKNVSPDEVVETFDKNIIQLIQLNDKPPEGNHSCFILGNADVPVSYQRNSFSGKTAQVSPIAVLKSGSPNTNNFEVHQDININDNTFSDDEKVNELIKNLELKKKMGTKNVESKGSIYKYLQQNSTRNEEVLMIRRNSSGHHTAQHETKYEPQSGANSKVYETCHIKSSSKHDDVILLENNMNLSAASRDLCENKAAMSASVLENVSFRRTEAWVDSTLPGNTRKLLTLRPSLEEPCENGFT